jgi:uncharacterized membrane protein YbhN (UPF0104 family)
MSSVVHRLIPDLHAVGHPHAGWLVLAILAEAVSLAFYAGVVRELLLAGGVRTSLVSLLRPTLGGIAMSASVPGGQAASAVYWFRELRRAGADARVSAFAMGGAMIAGAASLSALLVGGVAVAGSSGPLASVRYPLLGGGVAIVAAAALLRRRLAPLSRRIVPEPPAEARGRYAAVTAYAFANWLLDCACLVLSLKAMGVSVPPASILLAFALAQLVASIPFLPGGGGTVEASLVVAFGAFGHVTGPLLAGVLVFRLISCWGLVPVGWGAVTAGGVASLRSRAVAVPA